MNENTGLIDTFGRKIDYLRLSVTDRCDFRCQYCMAEDMTFLPRSQILSLEELFVVAKNFCALGVDKIRITGGEPLIRRDVIKLFEQLSSLQLTDLSLTTNGARLDTFAPQLVAAGVDRVNISLDTLKPERFKRITRTGQLKDVLRGIDAAQNAGFKAIKLNCVIMRNQNADEIVDITEFALNNELDISFIEEMPLGVISSHDRKDEFISSQNIREQLQQHFTLSPTTASTNGPSRYWEIQGRKSKIGFISPHSNNFCGTCNRVRVSADGKLMLCLGNEHNLDLRHIARASSQDILDSDMQTAIVNTMAIKPEKHEFNLDESPQILRFMNATGG